MKPIILIAVVVILFSACEDRQTRGIKVDDGVSKSLNDYRKESIGNILYTLILNIPENKNEGIKGGEQIDFQLKKNDKPLVIDFDAPEKNVLRVEVNGKEGGHHFENGHIILPVADLKVGANQVKIDFIADDKVLNRHDDYMFSFFAPKGASTVFPCFDQPNLKALFALNLIVPPAWQAVGNAPVLKVEKGPERVVFQFEPTKPISTYLFAFAAGTFEKVSRERNGRTVNLFYLGSNSESTGENSDYLFDVQLNALEWMEAYTKIAYPFQKYDMLLLPSLPESNVASAGLVYFETGDLLAGETATPEKDLRRARLIASRTARMWFGNLVSIDWFNDAWVNEVLADYLTTKMVNPSFRTIYHKLGFLTNHFPKSLAVDRSLGTHPIRQECDNLKDAGLLYDAIVYHKAPIVFRQLEKIVTEEKMRSGLITYLKKYSFSNAGWDDFVAILDSKTPDDLQSWSDIWFKETGMPEYKTFQEFDLYVINQFDQFDKGVIWPQRLDLYKKWESGWQHKDVWDDKQRFEFPIPDIVHIVILNWDAYAYGYFYQNFREKNFLLSKRMFELDPLRRGLSYITIWENLMRENLLPLEMRDALPLYLDKENQLENISLLLAYYEDMFWRFSDRQQRTTWAEIMEPLLWEKMMNAETGLEKSAFYKTFVKTAISRDGIEKMLALWRDEIKMPELKLSESDKISLACELAVRKGLPAAKNVPEDILEQQKQLTENGELQAKLDFISPALNKNEGIRNQFFESIKSPGNRTEEGFVTEALHYLHHPLRAQSAEKFILPSLEMLDEIWETGGLMFTDRWLEATFYGHRSASVVETVNDFLNALPELNPKLKLKVLRAVDPVQRAVKLKTELETGE
ncbi:MAG: hypothetical protein L3J66_04450 [Bacteroidales bacterium]|nr:hypothetical protein [Bacteroidales bacterium]